MRFALLACCLALAPGAFSEGALAQKPPPLGVAWDRVPAGKPPPLGDDFARRRQNVNFAVKGSEALAFLVAHGVRPLLAANPSTVSLQCFR